MTVPYGRAFAHTYNRAFAISKSNSVNFEQGPCDAVWVGGGGVVVAVFEDGVTIPFTCAAGTLLPIRIKRVHNTNTTATVMTAFYQV
jgi:hypothetical protein